MKKLIIVLLILICTSSVVISQVPNTFRYQAVIRDASGLLISNKNVSLQISILSGSAGGQPVYAETFVSSTNEFGIVSLNVGNGEANLGIFSQIDWSANSHYLQVEIDINGGENYQFMGTSQIFSVPYALQALDVINNDDDDANPQNEIQTISKNNNTVSLSNSGGSFTDEVDDADADPNNEIQTITKNGNIVTLSNSGGSFTDEVNDADASASNEIQILSKNGNIVSLSNSGGSFTDEINDADADASNEIQYLNLTSNILTITSNPLDTDPISLNAYQGTNTDEQTLSTNIVGSVVELTIGGGTGGNTVNIDLPDDFVSRQNGGTFTGSIFATNLSGTNTGDMDNADVVSAYQSGFPNYFTTADGIKLDGIEFNATADMTNGEVVSAYQSGYSGYFNSTDRTKLNGIEDNATADMSNGEIVTAYNTGFPEHFNTTDRTKIDRLTLSNNFTVSGGHTLQFNTSGATILSLPTSGSLATEAYVAANALSTSLSNGRIFVGEDGSAVQLDARGDGQILIGNGANLFSRAISGDISLLNSGAATVNLINGESISLGGSFSTTNDDIILVADNAGSNVILPLSGTLANQTYVNTQISDNNSSYVGSSSIITLGTISTGVWNAGAVTSSGAITGSSIIRNGGTSTEFLKADGSVDANTYLTSTSGVSSITGTVNQITTSSSTGAVTLSLPTAITGLTSITSTGFTGALSGNASTATALQNGRTISISGDLTYTSPSFVGSANITGIGTLATVNLNTGSFGSSSLIPAITVNEKGLITAISTSTVIAPAGTLTGTTLASGVVSSSLTAVGTITSGVWNGTAITGANLDLLIPGAIGSTTASTGAFTTLSATTVNISNVLNLIPLASAPGSPSEGDIYINSTDNNIYCYINSAWRQLNNL